MKMKWSTDSSFASGCERVMASSHTAPFGLPCGTRMSILSIALVWMLALLMLPGCTTSKTSDFSAASVPDEFSLTIYRRLTDGRHTYLTLSPQGVLTYGGGRAAISRLSTPVLTLTRAQRREVWSTIINNHLLETPSQSFKTAKTVAYEVQVLI